MRAFNRNRNDGAGQLCVTLSPAEEEGEEARAARNLLFSVMASPAGVVGGVRVDILKHRQPASAGGGRAARVSWFDLLCSRDPPFKEPIARLPGPFA